MKEFDQTKSVQDILQDLVYFCRLNSSEDVYLRVNVPANILGSFSKQFYPKEKILLEGASNNITAIKMLHLVGGKVELESTL